MPRSRLRPAAMVAGLAAITLGLTACGGPAEQAPAQSAADPRPTVVASTNAWGAVVRAVGGDRVRVEPIITATGTDPHGYEATPQDATKVGDSRLIVMNGGGYDAFMTELVQASGNRAPVIDAYATSGLAGAAPEPGAAGKPGKPGEHAGESPEEHAAHAGEAPGAHAGESPEEHAAHGATNEHVWYDPAAVQKVGAAIATRLGTLDPANKAYYETNARTLGTGTAQLTAKAAAIAKAHPGARVVATEPAQQYLLESAGLTDVTPEAFTSAVEEGTDAPAAAVAQTMGLFRAAPPVDVLVLNSQTQSPATDQVRAAAEQAGVPVVEMSETLPEGVTDYLPWMSSNLDALGAALAR